MYIFLYQIIYFSKIGIDNLIRKIITLTIFSFKVKFTWIALSRFEFKKEGEGIMKTIKKIISMLLICILIISLLPIQMMVSASVSWGTQFITSINITDRNGNTISEAPINTTFKIRYEWTIPNNVDVKTGNTMNIALPEGLQTAQNDKMEFRAASGALVATGQATSPGGKNYNITFTDYPETHSNVKGYIEFFYTVRFKRTT